MTTRIELTRSQAQLLAEIEVRRRTVMREWHVAVTLVGLDPEKIVGGNLAEDPHFLVREDSPVPADAATA